MKPNIQIDIEDPHTRKNYDGDGVLEVVTEIHQWLKSVEIIRAYDIVTHEIKWEYVFDAEDPEYNFWGFYDFNGNGAKAAVLEWYDKKNQEKIIEIIDTRDNTIEFVLKKFDFHCALDIDNDGLEDLFVSLSDYPQEQPAQYQIWGTGSAAKVNSNSNPAAYKLSQNYPNPFNPVTTINYSVQVSGNVKITVYNNLGQTVRTIVNEQKSVGEYTIIWDGKNENGSIV